MVDDRNGLGGRDLPQKESGGEPYAGAPAQSRGERFDEEQGGGRGPESVSPDDDEIAADQQAHQDRGQSEAEFEREQP